MNEKFVLGNSNKDGVYLPNKIIKFSKCLDLKAFTNERVQAREL